MESFHTRFWACFVTYVNELMRFMACRAKIKLRKKEESPFVYLMMLWSIVEKQHLGGYLN